MMKLTKKQLDENFKLLNDTALFLTEIIDCIVDEINALSEEFEKAHNDEEANEISQKIEFLNQRYLNTIKKIEWEKLQIEKFKNLVKVYETAESKNFISQLSKNLLNYKTKKKNN